MSRLVTLPAELTLKVLGWLDFRSLLTCKMVCRALHALVVSSSAMEYTIALGAAAREDGPPSAVSRRERLEQLAQHDAAWAALQWTQERVVPMLTGGVWELYGGVLAQARGRETLVFTQLPSQIKGIAEREWECHIGVQIRDFGMDPAQDLLVVIEAPSGNGTHRIHLRELSTAKPHPKAKSPIIVTGSPENAHYTFAIQVCNEHLGVLFIGDREGNGNQLLIYNWKSGELVNGYIGSEMASFSFLTTRHILIAYVNPMFLEEDDIEPGFLVIDFTRPPTTIPTSIRDTAYECAFELPEMEDTGIAVSLTIRSDPAPTWAPSDDLQVPFHIAREDRLFVNTLWVADGHTITSLLILVPSATFVSRLTSLDPAQRGWRFAWDEWGRTGSRVREAPPGHSMVWVCYVSGLSFAAPYRNGTEVFEPPRGPKSVQIFDFSPVGAARALQNEGEGGEERGATKVITKESSVTVSGVFVAPVRTSLPYRWKARRVPGNAEHTFDAVMLSEDAIVTVTSHPDVREYRVLSF